ncbi:hypothetical protein GOV14_06745 [Candidatus Pacearchaeota archaeon]|nr:hypothetical protein [Candidatus Pacearchaeota archaeon]
MMTKKRKRELFNKICKNIKDLRIQGARNVARSAFRAYKLVPTFASKNKLLSLRPTEPLLHHILERADDWSSNDLRIMINENQEIINKHVYKLIKKNSVIFTHCHSSSVVNALMYAKDKGKKFEVYHTETRPLYQGRKTARDLRKVGINVTLFVDSAAGIALTKSQGTKDVDLVLFGADAITINGVVNKIGSGMFAQIARANKIPVYILADSWKYSRNIKLEQRDPDEIWDTKKRIKIKNPAFGLVKKKYIKRIISELGTLTYDQFIENSKND